MTDDGSRDGHDPDLGERMERAVGGLRAPDVVVDRAVARGRRQRSRRRLAYAAGGVAAATALVLTVPTFATDGPGREQGPSGPPVAADPAATSPTSTSPTSTSPTSTSPTTAPAGTGGSAVEQCGATETGWWSKSTAQIEADLVTLLPEGTGIGRTSTDVPGEWRGNLVTGGDPDFASLTLLPPPGILGPRRTLDEAFRLGPCGGGANEPMQTVKPCDEITGPGHVACAEIRAEDGTLVGVVTEQTQLEVVDSQEQPTDQTYVLAAVAVPGGGHVELHVAEGTPADRPNTVHDPADAPALTMRQVREVLTDPVWTS